METLRKLFEGDTSSKMTLDLEEVDTGSSGDSGPTAYRRKRGKGKTPERSQRPAGGHPRDSPSGTQNLWPMARRPVSRHTRAEAVDTGSQRDIPVL